MSTNLAHWHQTDSDTPPGYVDPPACCASKLGDVIDRIDTDHQRRLEDAVRNERVRIVTESLAAIRAYSDAAQSVLTDAASVALVATIADKCAALISKVGCICPQIEITSFGGPTRYMPGRDHRCGMHDEEHGPGRGETGQP